MARIVEAVLTAKLEVDVTLGFDGPFAADLRGRARAFQSMVLGGMGVQKTAALVGLMNPRSESCNRCAISTAADPNVAQPKAA